MAINVPGNKHVTDLGHTSDHNLIRQALLDLDAQKAQVGSAVPLPDGAASAGTSADAAREDHVHAGLSVSSSAPPEVGLASSAGTSPSAARADHTHGGLVLTGTTPSPTGAASAVGTGTTAARADHVHATTQLASTAPADVAGAAAVGSGLTAARADHVHAGVQLASTAPAAIASASSVGVGTTAARADHVHQGLLGGNLLTAAQANAESGWVGGHANVSYTTLNARSGTSLTIENTRNSWSLAQTATWIPVVAGRTYTATAWAANVDATSGAVGIYFANDSGSKVGDIAPAFTSTTPQRYITTGVAPAGATKALMHLYNTASAAGQRVTYDEIGFWEGAGGDWALPGSPITNQGIRTTHPNGDDVLCEQWDASSGRWQTVHYDSGWRDMASLATANTGQTVTTLRVRRNGNRVTFVASITNTAGGNRLPVLTLPTGFRAALAGYYTCPFDANPTSPVQIWYVAPGGAVQYAQAANAGRYNFSVEFTTDDAIPTSLPGTKQTAAPFLEQHEESAVQTVPAGMTVQETLDWVAEDTITRTPLALAYEEAQPKPRATLIKVLKGA
jgi:hypothetical protein